MTSESIREKGKQLAQDGRVGEPVRAAIFSVRGISDTYEVMIAEDHEPTCTCPAHGRCKHIWAVAYERAFGGHVYEGAEF